MKPTFYPRLAWMGIKKNARLYVPYLLSCAFMTAMLYVIAYLAVTPALYTVNGKVNGSGTSAVAMTMSLGSSRCFSSTRTAFSCVAARRNSAFTACSAWTAAHSAPFSSGRHFWPRRSR